MSREIDSVSILLPVHNERETILAHIEGLSAAVAAACAPRDVELLLLDNASTDGTSDLGALLMERVPKAKIISVATKGRGAALNAGFAVAVGDAVAVLAIDRAWDEEFLKVGLQGLDNGFDVVYGQKSHAKSRVDRPLHREMASLILRLLVAGLFFVRPQDTQCVKIFRRSRVQFLRAMHDFNYFAETEFFLRSRANGLRTLGVPVNVRDRRRGSKVKLSSFWEFVCEAWAFRCNSPLMPWLASRRRAPVSRASGGGETRL